MQPLAAEFALIGAHIDRWFSPAAVAEGRDVFGVFALHSAPRPLAELRIFPLMRFRSSIPNAQLRVRAR